MKNNTDKKIRSLIWQLILPYKGLFLMSIGIILLGKSVMSILPLGIKWAIDILREIPIVLELFGCSIFRMVEIGISEILIFMSGILVFAFFTQYFQVIVTNRFGQKIMRDLRTRLFSHVLRQSASFFDKSQLGQLLTRIIHDVQSLNELFVAGISSIFGDLFLIVCILVISFYLDVRLALISFLSLPLLYLVMLIFKKKARQSFLEVRRKLSKMNGFLQSSINGVKIIQILRKENKMTRLFRRIQKEYLEEYLRTVRIYSLYFPSLDFLSVFSLILLLIFGSYWVSVGELEISALIVFLFYSPMLFGPLRELSEQYNLLQSALASAERISQLLETQEFIPQVDQPIRKKTFQSHIEFRNVFFSYKDEAPVLKGVSFHIEKGETVAIIGLTGQGKSTIVHLMSRLYDIQEGEILVDGIPIQQIDLGDLRGLFSYVFQDFLIFSASIEDNLRLFDSEISSSKIQEIAKKIQANAFIQNRKDAYQSMLGEYGIGISFGEKQLLSFARALVQEREILIFDEATSNIDPDTERLIQKNIRGLLQMHTTIIIAHRLSTIREVDKIMVLNEGKIVEMGNHNELLKKKGLYKRLYELQFQGQ